MSSTVPAPPPPPPIHSSLPTRPLKPLFWKRLQFGGSELSFPTDVVWKEIEIHSLEDAEAFRRLFQVRDATPTDGRSRHLAGRESNTIRLLDRKKSQAIEIFLKGMHVECEELQDALLNLDTNIVDPSTMIALLDVMPMVEEIEVIHTYLEKHPNCSLDGPEMFLYQLSSIDCLRERAQCFIIQAQFREHLTTLRQHLLTLQQASQALFRNPQLNKVLGLILAVGNKMNEGNLIRGEANGFQIDILSRLKDVKSSDGSNLLEYIVNYFCSYTNSQATVLTGNAIFPLPCHTLLSAASGISFEELKHGLQSLKQSLTECKGRFKGFETAKGSGEFRRKMELFLKSAHGELDSCHKWMTSVRELFYTVVKYYCVQLPTVGGALVTPKHFFELWIPFLQQFKQSWEKEQKLLARKRVEKMQSAKMAAAQLRPLSSTGLKAKLRSKMQK